MLQLARGAASADGMTGPALCLLLWTLVQSFIDPTGNMLASSGDLQNANWLRDSGLTVMPGALDAFGTKNAFTLTNTSQANAY